VSHNFTPGSADDWLARAKGDLALARVELPAGAFYEDLCYHAQQAAEKAIKAVYQHHDWDFRYTHDLDELFHGLRDHGVIVPPGVVEARSLTSFAWQARYPGLDEPVSDEDHQEAVRLAHNVVTWAEQEIRGR
jgi:HEPN domain-containing protein